MAEEEEKIQEEELTQNEEEEEAQDRGARGGDDRGEERGVQKGKEGDDQRGLWDIRCFEIFLIFENYHSLILDHEQHFYLFSKLHSFLKITILILLNRE